MRKWSVLIILLCVLLSACGKATEVITETPSDNTTVETSSTPDTTATSDPEATTESLTPDETTSPDVSGSNTSTPTKDNTPAGTTSQKPKDPPASSTPSQTKPPVTSTPPTTSTPPVTSTPAPARECVSRPDLAKQLFAEINKHRKANGVSELTWVDSNANFAYKQAWYNAYNDVPNKATHTVDQIGVWGGVLDANNIVTTAINAWKASAGHNRNMLDTIYNRAGVSVIEIKRNGYTVEFIAIVDFDYIDYTHEEMPIMTQ